ncbi:MAG TPA: UDP-N-acetylmuramoyl-L-alanine--D-glutamate ligase [Acidimicrobiales bacterium]|nr:UDP-N-acetylmuramoyl-L-alanine--D-glutamate ligase [Acidimicrobiales bacterium]
MGAKRHVARRALVVGFARTGRSVAVALARRGCAVTAVDDAGGAEMAAVAEVLGVAFVAAPDEGTLAGLVAEAEQVVVSPGVPPSHPIYRLATAPKLVAEIELAFSLTELPVVAVTGTNGKTTVTELVTEMLVASGRRALAAGNIGLPLIEAIDDERAELLVAEVSSFQLKYTATFAPTVATYLNLAEDHLDWHPTMEDYAASKARIFACQGADDVAVVNAEDPAVLAAAAGARSRRVTFGAGGDYEESAGFLVGPGGERLLPAAALPRRLPHDVANALAALATARAAGASPEGCRAALEGWHHPPHRVEFVAERGGVAYYDDSKATTPSAVVAALAGFEHVVLIAGGKNKGLDLGVIPRALGARRDSTLRAVVAIGEAAGEVAAAFSGLPLRRAATMAEAIGAAGELARPGDVVLLSPGCTSFDWYASYAARGEDFQNQVRALAVASGGGR